MRSLSSRLACLTSIACLCSVPLSQESAEAQSSTRTVIPNRSVRTAPARNVPAMPVGLQGYCPVCVIESKKWVKGNPAIQAKHDGKTYYFPGDEQRNKFLANPAKYTPALGGDCAVCRLEMGQQVNGSVRFSALHENRLFLFPNAEIKSKFMASPSKYADADLALDGNCPVCRVEMKQAVEGSPEFTANYKGMRYLFPSDKQRQMFLASPTKYAVAPGAGGEGSGTK